MLIEKLQWSHKDIDDSDFEHLLLLLSKEESKKEKVVPLDEFIKTI